MEEEKVSFKPVNSGLGFHPFSDGLPYAPVGKKKPLQKERRPNHPPRFSTNSTGAVTAGAPQFISQEKTPIVRWKQEPPRKQPAVQTTQPPQPIQTEYGWAYLFKRPFAYILDSAINLTLCLGGIYLILWYLKVPIQQLISPDILWVAAAFLFVFNWSLIAAQEIAFNTSLGKHMVGISLEGGFGAVFIRSIFFLPCFILVFPLMMAIFDKKKRCLHDQISGIQPFEVVRF